MQSFRNIFLLLFTAGLLLTSQARSQRAYPIEINSLLGRVPIPHDSKACYTFSTHITDSSNGAVSIKDNGAGFKELQDQFDRITKAAMSDVMAAGTPTSATPPSAEQIEQMKQQALAKASQMQSMNAQQMAQMQSGNATAARPGANDIELMKLIGQAQSACGRISELTRELSAKVATLNYSAIDRVPIGSNCPDVQQGSYAGPTCACMVQRATAYETKRVAARDALVQQVNALLTDYMGKLRVQIATVDDAVAKAKYGDAISNPAFKQQVAIIQRQALAGVVSVTSIASGHWEDAAKQYAGVVNASSGASVGCNGHK